MRHLPRTRPSIPTCVVAAVLLLTAAQPVKIVAQTLPILEVTTSAGTHLGLPIHWGPDSVILLQPSGKMQFIDQTQIVGHRKRSTAFRPTSLASTRAAMQNELGNDFETLISAPYVIGAPRGHIDRWKTRFDALLSGYRRYFNVRHWKIREADFPLQVYVLRSRQEFIAYSTKNGASASANTIGSYFPNTNTCILYELPGAGGTNWTETEATIVHEAVHQLAFNTGVHERLFENPLWCVEGLATLFEKPSVYDPRAASSTVSTRLNEYQRDILKDYCDSGGRLEELLAHIIATDEAFSTNPQEAYAASWALTFYLTERMPRQYKQLLQRQQARGFGAYSSRDRIRDFQRSVNVPISTLALQVKRLLSIQ